MIENADPESWDILKLAEANQTDGGISSSDYYWIDNPSIGSREEFLKRCAEGTVSPTWRLDEEKENETLIMVFDAVDTYFNSTGKHPFFKNYGVNKLQAKDIADTFHIPWNSIEVFPKPKRPLSENDVVIKSPDWICPILKVVNGEFKSRITKSQSLTRSSLLTLMFDKMYTVERLNEVLAHDALHYALFDKFHSSSILFSMLILGKKSMEILHPRIQELHLETKTKIEREDTRRDEIQLPVIEVIELLSCDQMILKYHGKRISKQDLLSTL